MSARAIVIAVEEFVAPAESDLPGLPGVNAAAQQFVRWLRATKGLSDDSLVFCAHPRVPEATSGATKPEVLRQIAGKTSAWRDATDELYFYFAGHGFSFRLRDYQPYTDALACSDYTTRAAAGTACLQLQELQAKLRSALGKGKHFYFLDGCRNPASPNEVEVPESGIVLAPSRQGTPCTYTIHSAPPGQATPNDPRFAELLLEGLGGKGRAKVAAGAAFYVTFDRLREFLERKLAPREIDARTEGGGDGRIVRLASVPLSVCNVTVKRARDDDAYDLTVYEGGYAALPPIRFTGPEHALEIRPDDYAFELKLAGAPVPRVEPRGDPIDANDPISIVFERPAVAAADGDGARLALEGMPRLGAGAGSTPPPAPAPPPPAHAPAAARRRRTQLEVVVPQGCEVRLHGSAVDRTEARTFQAEVRPGRYFVELVERGAVVASTAVVVGAGEQRRVDLVAEKSGAIHGAILAALPPAARAQEGVYFSEGLGPMANPDLSVWMAILGASRILGREGTFSKLVGLGLAGRELERHVDPAHGATFVLSALPAETVDGVALGRWPAEALTPVPAVPGLAQAVLPDPDPPGPRLLALRGGAGEELRLATAVLPGRVTLVTLAPRESGGLAIRQLMLPMHDVPANVPDELLEPFRSGSPLRFVRFSVEAQRRFLQRREAFPEGRREIDESWLPLLHAKWLDPVMSLVGAYELLRRGRPNEARPVLTAIRNLGRYFGALPDVVALRRLAGEEDGAPGGLPLFLDGTLALGAGMPGYTLDYGAGWTVLLPFRKATVAPAARGGA